MTMIFPQLKAKKLTDREYITQKNPHMMWGRKQDESYEALN